MSAARGHRALHPVGFGSRQLPKPCHDVYGMRCTRAMVCVQGKKRAAISNWMCHDASDACSKKAPALTVST